MAGTAAPHLAPSGGTVALVDRRWQETALLRWAIPGKAWLERWPDGPSDRYGELVEGSAELVTGGDVGGDVVVAAAQVLDDGVTGGENPR